MPRALPRRGAPSLRRRAAHFLASLLLLLAPPLLAGRPPLQSIDLSRGLAGDRTWDLEVDGAGALWVATATGVSRFDGVRFRNFDVRHGLPHVNVIRLLRLADGRIAAATGAGVAMIDPIGATGEVPWRALPSDVERGGGQLVEIVEEGSGTVWAGGPRGLFRVEKTDEGERLVAVERPSALVGVGNIAPAGGTAGGALWVSDANALYRRSAAGVWEGPWTLPAALADVTGLSSLWVNESGLLWAASRTGLCALAPELAARRAGGFDWSAARVVELAAARAPRPGEAGICVDVEHGLPPTRSRRIIEPGAAGRRYVTGTGGVVEIAPQSWSVRLTPVDTAGAALQSILEGVDGTLWIATSERGLLRVMRSGFELESGEEGLPGAVSTLLTRGDEVAVVVDHLDAKRRLLRRGDGSFVDVTPSGAERIAASWGWGAASALDARLDWWVGVAGGLVRFPRLPGERYGPAEPPLPRIARELERHRPIRLFFARDEALWVSSYEPVALHRFEPARDAVGEFPEVATFGVGAASAFAEGPEGTLYLGFFQGGLARRRAESGVERLEAAAAVARGFVYALHLDGGGRLWVAAGGGLVRCETPSEDDPRCVRAVPGTELDHLQVFGVAEDRHGRIYAATAKGLFVLEPTTGRLARLTTSDGLPGNNLAALAVAADGALWLGADRAVSRFSPRPPGPGPAPARIVALAVAGRPREVPLAGVATLPPIVLGPSERSVEIEAASVSLGSDGPPLFQWRIGEGEWTPPSGEGLLRLAGLAPGRLAIEVRALSAAGVASAKTARAELRILPPFWRRSGFLAAVAFAVAAALAGMHRLRVRRLLELERVRTRIASDLHDDLGSSLSRISILAEVARRQAGGGEAESTLETIGASARELAEMASDIVWAIDPQRDDLASWGTRLRRFGDDLFTPLGVAFEVRAPEGAASIRLPAATRRDLYLLAKEALNNAAKYAGAGRVQVVASRRPGGLALEIEDDGRGFDAGDVANAEARGRGHGLRAMRERAVRLGGELELGMRPGGGTRIALSVPL